MMESKTKNSRKKISKKSKKENVVILENKKRFEEIKKEEKEEKPKFEDEDLEDIEFSEGLRLVSSKRNLENINVGETLEATLAFAPRFVGTRGELKNYSDTKYQKNYMENKYGEKTPGLYSESVSTSSEESKSNSSDGKQ